MRTINYPSKAEWPALLQRPVLDAMVLESTVSAILNDVKQNGDGALRKYAQRFDGAEPDSFLISEKEFTEAENLVPAELKKAILLAKANIKKFHLAQREKEQVIETSPGVKCWRKSVPIEKVGLYIPGGTAPLFSTVLMLGVPAIIAGCKEVVLCTPSTAPAILFTARLLGISKIYRIGGAQAIAAMAYGTESVPAVYKIFGPGNQYVTCAKQLVSRQGIAIDMPAGPSELAVLANKTCVPAFVAADLLSQAEHGIDSQVVLVSDSENVIAEVIKEVELQLPLLPRKEIAQQALGNSKAILVKDLNDGMALLNEYAPEHLIIACADKIGLAEKVVNAGSVFLGNYSPESAGDYASGTNHSLPTGGYAKVSAGVSLDSFAKKITFQELTQEGLLNIGSAVEAMALGEGLKGHAKAVSIRMVNGKSIMVNGTDVNGLLRKCIKDITPYSSARGEFDGKAEIFLDANENSLAGSYNRYPDPLQRKLKEKIADMKDISAENIFLGNGSDEAIDLLIRAFCEPGIDSITIVPPTYGMYEVAAAINDVEAKQILLKKDFQLDTDSILNSSPSKVLFLCSPNNPTGNCLRREDVLRILNAYKGIVVLDEAYIDFANEASYLKELEKYPNLVILQTFSKAWGMAGLRLGVAFANERIIEVMNKIKAPYNVNGLSQEIAIQALDDVAQVKKWVEEICAERARMSVEIGKLPFVITVFPSDANFLLVRIKKARKMYEFLRSEGVVVRDRSRVVLCEDCLRFTIGTKNENDLLLKKMKEYSLNQLSPVAV